MTEPTHRIFAAGFIVTVRRHKGLSLLIAVLVVAGAFALGVIQTTGRLGP